MNNRRITDGGVDLVNMDIQKMNKAWRMKSWSIPDIMGGKQVWFRLVKRLVELVEAGQACDLDSLPDVYEITRPQSWRAYTAFLKGVGFVKNQAGRLLLTEVGMNFLEEPTQRSLANQIQERYRLFGEVLGILEEEPATVEETDKKLCDRYGLDWNNLSNVRRRMDWLEVLGLIQAIGDRKWEVTAAGREALKDWCLVSPDILQMMDAGTGDMEINDPPEEIAILLQRLNASPELHKKRCTYNIWAPSPNRIENIRMIVQVASNRLEKKDLFEFVENEFHLKMGSVKSMLPFLKAAGLLEEVGRNIYEATPAAKAWLQSGNDLDFIRILHANMRFVGEMIKAAEQEIARNDMYAQAALFGLNKEKARWIAGFLLEAGLLEETWYLHLKATRIGRRFAADLPLDEVHEKMIEQKELLDAGKGIAAGKGITGISKVDTGTAGYDGNAGDTGYDGDTKGAWPLNRLEIACSRLHSTSTAPGAEGKNAGVAFEESIADIFCLMGFKAERIGGSGGYGCGGEVEGCGR